MISSYTLTLVLIIVISISYCELQTYAFYIPTIVIGGGTKDVISSSNYIDDTIKDRPLLRKFKQGIQKRIRHSSEGINRNGQVDAYKSAETFPCLNMQSCTYNDDVEDNLDVTLDVSSRTSIRKAFTESSRIHNANYCNVDNQKELLPLPHGRSIGSGCSIIRLTGSDASSIRKLTQYGADFFEQVDDTSCNNSIMDAGVFTIADHIVAGYDDNVNDEGKMQFLDTRILPNKQLNSDPLLLPLEVGELVGEKSLGDAHEGMNILLDIGTQITSAILDMDSISADKLIDDGTHVDQQTSDNKEQQIESTNMMKDDISNSYHRLIRYLKPKESTDETIDAAFKAHYDSTFLTLIPLPKLPGLEVWCPSNEYTASTNNQDSQSKGEWVRPKIPVELEEEEEEEDSKSAYIIVLAGEFLQLTSDGKVPTCIHRVIPPSSKQNERYIPRISSPMFLRPRRGAAALLSVSEDLKLIDKSNNDMPYGDALYFQQGLLDECDGMQLWAAH